MAMCEDFPCCGHEQGCCPDFDENGKQLNMKCTCGATVPINSSSSLCPTCLNRPEEYDEFGFWENDEDSEGDEGERDEDDKYEDPSFAEDYHLEAYWEDRLSGGSDYEN